MELQQATLLDWVAVINAVVAGAALIIHAIRVPYRESAAREQVAATDSILRVREQMGTAGRPPASPVQPAPLTPPRP